MTNLILSVVDSALGIEPSDTLQQIPLVHLIDKLNRADPAFMNRQMLDHTDYLTLTTPDNRRRQVLPYFILTDGKSIRLYYRGKGGEARLTSKASIGYGGHIELSDVVTSEENGKEMLNIYSTILSCLRREYQEELQLDYRPWRDDAVETDFHYMGVISSKASAVDEVHLGVVFTKMVSCLTRYDTSTDDTILNEEQMPIWHDVAHVKQYQQMELWSKIVYDFLQKK